MVAWHSCAWGSDAARLARPFVDVEFTAVGSIAHTTFIKRSRRVIPRWERAHGRSRGLSVHSVHLFLLRAPMVRTALMSSTGTVLIASTGTALVCSTGAAIMFSRGITSLRSPKCRSVRCPCYDGGDRLVSKLSISISIAVVVYNTVYSLGMQLLCMGPRLTSPHSRFELDATTAGLIA